ncbi:MAG: tetratricopeptide repeat protein [Meiothermus sp.]|uniref:tetratricopeptide repeat protein n=1 Tax=Meiothermus sp. TaxID=1955249 RepID=UPI0025F094BC|nr:tetratricopeptide repeat protein [Meiothermus sp.]MCS7067313.1 tetratricopeptide repeat protein [Meiothermus sp.]MDW8424607.1 tetratricopeptide repeat protein [Meiothermus sp.]
MNQLDATTGIERALQHLSRGEPVLALRVLDRVSWMDLGWPDYWRVRAEAFLMLGDYKQAASSAREGLVEDPENLPLLLLHIKALVELGDLDRAQYALNQALRLAPNDLELQRLGDRLELQMDRRPHAPKTVYRPPTPTIPEEPAHARDDWKNARDWRSGRPMFNEADASAIKRAFTGHTPSMPKPRVQRRNFSFIPVGFFLLSLAFTAYWLWSYISR